MTLIRETRKATGLKLREFARKANIYPSTASRIECGEKTGPTLQARVAAALGKQQTELFDADGWPLLPSPSCA